eukprot:6202653-Pleurochrysis_carterae.AAC.1
MQLRSLAQRWAFQLRRGVRTPSNVDFESKTARSNSTVSAEMRLREVPMKLASEKSVSVMTEPCSCAKSNLACMPARTRSKTTQCILAEVKSVMRRTVSVRSARNAPVKSAASRMAPCRSTPRRSAPRSGAPVKSALAK